MVVISVEIADLVSVSSAPFNQLWFGQLYVSLKPPLVTAAFCQQFRTDGSRTIAQSLSEVTQLAIFDPPLLG